MNSFPDMETIESCQGDGGNRAWVSFKYGDYFRHPWRELAEFMLDVLGPGIKNKVGDRADVLIRVSENQRVFGELSVEQGTIQRVTKVVRGLGRKC